jgi:hypothetical protein
MHPVHLLTAWEEHGMCTCRPDAGGQVTIHAAQLDIGGGHHHRILVAREEQARARSFDEAGVAGCGGCGWNRPGSRRPMQRGWEGEDPAAAARV